MGSRTDQKAHRSVTTFAKRKC